MNRYAHLGLVDSGYAIQPDYTKDNSLDKVLIDTARHIIHYQGDLEVINYAVPSESGIMLPSWVPDWIKLSVDAGSSRFSESPYATRNRGIRFIHNGKVLSLKGVLLGTLHTTQAVAYLPNTSVVKCCIAEDCYVDFWKNEVLDGDQAWLLFGAKYLFIFRKVGRVFKLVSKAGLKDASGAQYIVDPRKFEPTRIHII